MGAIERAKQDVEAGRHWLARQRLRSYLITNGYDADVLATIGQISQDMHDEFDAGRMWLLSSATGPEVDAAMETFVSRAGKEPNQIASQLPRAVRLKMIEDYPELARTRIEKFGLASAIAYEPRIGNEHRPFGWIGRTVITTIVIVGLVTGIVVFVAGLYSLEQWIFG